MKAVERLEKSVIEANNIKEDTKNIALRLQYLFEVEQYLFEVEKREVGGWYFEQTHTLKIL